VSIPEQVDTCISALVLLQLLLDWFLQSLLLYYRILDIQIIMSNALAGYTDINQSSRSQEILNMVCS